MVDPQIGGGSIDAACNGSVGQEQAQPFQVNAACTVTSIRTPTLLTQPLEAGKIIGIASNKAASPAWLGKFTGPGPGNGWQTYLLDTPAVLAPATTYYLINTGIYGGSVGTDPVLSGVLSSLPKTIYYGPTYTGGPVAFYSYLGLYGTVTATGGGTSGGDNELRAMRAYVGAPAAAAGLNDVRRMYYWMKLGNALPAPSNKSTMELARMFWNMAGGGSGFSGPTGIRNPAFSTGVLASAYAYSFTPTVAINADQIVLTTELAASGNYVVGIASALGATPGAATFLSSVTVPLGSDATYTLDIPRVALAAGTTYYLVIYSTSAVGRSLYKSADVLVDNCTLVNWNYTAASSGAAWSAPAGGALAADIRIQSNGYIGGTPSLDSSALEQAFYTAQGISPVGRSREDQALAYWSGQ